MNNLTDEKRYQLKIAVILIVIIFIAIYGTIIFLKYAKQQPAIKSQTENGQVIFKQPKLQFFNYTTRLNAYPDRITIHFPYFIILRPDQFRSEIYNIESKSKEKEINEVILDYFNGEIVYNKQGFQTYFNKKNLGLLCDQAFIKNKTEILCITRPDKNKQNNKLIIINPETLKQKDLYTSQNTLTAVYFAQNTLYIGEYDFTKNKAFITANSKTASIDDLINIIYPIGDDMYAASFKSLKNNQTETYYRISVSQNVVQTKLIDKNIIVFH